MSEPAEQLYGGPEREQAMGYEPMPADPRVPAEPASEPSFADVDAAVEERTKAPVSAPVLERAYVNLEKPDELASDKFSLSQDRAFKDLAAQRGREFDVVEQLKAQQLKEALDAARSPVAAEVEKAKAADWSRTAEEIAALPIEQQIAKLEELRRHQAEQPQPTLQQSPEPTPEQRTAHQELSELFQRRPELIQAFEAQRQTDLAAGQKATAEAEQFAIANGQITLGILQSRHPALRGLTDWRQLPLILNALAPTNPQEAKAIIDDLNAGKGALVQAEQAQQQQAQRDAQRYAYEWSRWTAEEDAKWMTAVPEAADPAKAGEIAGRCRTYLNDIGLNNEDIERLWQGNNSISLRDSRAQRILYDAMRFREAQAAVPAARKNLPTRVQKPGAAGTMARQEDVDMRVLSNQLTGATGSNAARIAAQMIAERRRRR